MAGADPEPEPPPSPGFERNPWQSLLRVSSLLTSLTTDPESTLSDILDPVLELTRGDRALVLLADDDGRLEVRARRAAGGGEAKDPDQVSWTIVRQVFQTGTGVFVPEIGAEAALAEVRSIKRLDLRSVLCVPLRTGFFDEEPRLDDRRRHPPHLGLWQEVIGVIYVDSTRPRTPYTADHLALLQALANAATTAITNARLYGEATRDPASGLFTRRYFEVLLGKVHRLSRRFDFPYGLLLVELDAGEEEAVRGAARALAGALRRSDLPSRRGSNALAALLPYAAPEDVIEVAAKVVGALPPARIGASAVPAPAKDAFELVTQADRALAAAGRDSRGRTLFWTADVGLEGPRADRLAGLVSGSEGEDHRRLERLVEEKEALVAELAGLSLLGESPAMLASFERLRRVAPTTATVLVRGESGTGKELFARALHRLSARAAGPFVVLDCGAIPDSLVESEIFGHEAGAFTGASRRHEGKFEQAQGGTLFLDEVGELPLPLQTRFLRALQEHEIHRVGGTEPIRLDVRIVAATHRDLERAIGEGAFRQDLWYRLNQVTVDLPPLRERGRDLLLLARHYLDRFSRELRRPLAGLDEGAQAAILAYGWPGNVRELEHRIQQAAILAPGPGVGAADLALPTGEAPAAGETFKEARRRALEAWEREYILRLLALYQGDVAACAREMGLSERRFREIRQELGIRSR